MLAVVKAPHIELSISGNGAAEALAWLSRKFKVELLSEIDDADSLPVKETPFWKEMEKNRVGNMLAGARVKAGMTQKQLAESIGVKQNMISDYETGRRILSKSMARKFAEILDISPSRFGK